MLEINIEMLVPAKIDLSEMCVYLKVMCVFQLFANESGTILHHPQSFMANYDYTHILNNRIVAEVCIHKKNYTCIDLSSRSVNAFHIEA